jgi:hypothetical protein
MQITRSSLHTDHGPAVTGEQPSAPPTSGG